MNGCPVLDRLPSQEFPREHYVSHRVVAEWSGERGGSQEVEKLGRRESGGRSGPVVPR